VCVCECIREFVSIHAPAWGATLFSFVVVARSRVSIHAPAWGATSVSSLVRPGDWSFNPRARVGRDNMGAASRNAAVFQSTRPRGARPLNDVWALITAEFQSTRPRGARRRRPARHQSPRRFNPRARVGRDRHPAKLIDSVPWFQSTRPRGARPSPAQAVPQPARFNPRARVGRDRRGPRGERQPHVSIHAPAWGATFQWLSTGDGVGFNPRARVGRDRLRGFHFGRAAFQSTRPRGARHVRGVLLRDAFVSIHAPAWGATKFIGNPRMVVGFQSTRPRGARLWRRPTAA